MSHKPRHVHACTASACKVCPCNDNLAAAASCRLHHLLPCALQASALKLWVEDKAKPALDVRKRAQTMAAKLAAANGAATLGQFTGQHPSITSGPLIEAFRGLSNPAAPAKA